MGFYTARLRRAIPLCSSLIHHHFHTSKVTSPIHSIASTLPHTLNPQISGASNLSGLQSFRLFRSSPVSLSSRKQRFDDEREITEDTILFEGCDYNHWLITVDFPKDTPAEEKIATYERAATQVFGSMEEAKKRIYACSTTVYDGFQVECSEEISEKFKDVAGVVFVLPDSYIDPVNKRYGGDKYINGEIIPMPPPINYMRRESRPRPQRNENRSQMSGYENRGPVQGEGRRFGPPQNPPYQQSFGPPQNPPHQQNFGHSQNPPHQQNFGPPQNPPHQQNFGHSQNPPHQQNFGHSQNPPHQQNFGQSQNPPNQQNFGHSQNLPHQQNFGPPQNAQYQQNFGPPQNPQQNFGHPQNPPHHFGTPQNPPFQQNFGPQRGPVPQQNYPFPQNAPPQQNYGVQQNFSPQQNSNSAERHFPSQQSHTPPGGVGHQDSTVAPGVWDHREAGRTDFPQGGGTENYSGHVEDQKFSKVEQSRI